MEFIFFFLFDRFVNVNRLQTGIDNYGCGRYPFYMEPVVVVSITDGNSLTCPVSGVVGEVMFLLIYYMPLLAPCENLKNHVISNCHY